MKMMEYLKSPKKIFSPPTLSRSISRLYNRELKTKPKEEKTLNMLTRTMDGMDYNTLIMPCENDVTQSTVQA